MQYPGFRSNVSFSLLLLSFWFTQPTLAQDSIPAPGAFSFEKPETIAQTLRQHLQYNASLRKKGEYQLAALHIDTIAGQIYRIRPHVVPGLIFEIHKASAINYEQTNRIDKAVICREDALEELSNICPGSSLVECMLPGPEYMKSFWTEAFRPIIKLYMKTGFYHAAGNYLLPDSVLKAEYWGKYQPELADALSTKAEVTLRLGSPGDTLKALGYFRKASVLTFKDYEQQCRVQLNMAHVLRMLQRFEESENSFRSAFQLINSLQDKKALQQQLLLDAYLFQGYLARDKSRMALPLEEKKRFLEQSIAYYQSAFPFTQTSEDIIYLHQALGDIRREQGEPEAAIQHYHEALQALFGNEKNLAIEDIPASEKPPVNPQVIYILDGVIQSRYEIFQKNQDTGELRKALAAFRFSQRAELRLRNYYHLEVSRLQLSRNSRQRLNIAMKATYALWQQTREPELFQLGLEIIENSRSRELRASLRQAMLWSEEYQLDSLMIRRDLAAWALHDQQRKIDSMANTLPPDSEALAQARLHSEQLKMDLFQLSYLCREKYPRLYDLKFGKDTIDMAALKDHLHGEKAMVAYFHADDEIYAMATDGEQEAFFYLPVDDRFQSAFHQFSSLIRKPNLSQDEIISYQHSGKTLYDVLLGPVSGWDSEELMIVPDHSLGFLPFEALLTDTCSSYFYYNFPYAWKKHVIRYAFSIQLELARQYPDKKITRYRGFAPGGGRTAYSPLTRGLDSLVHNKTEVVKAGGNLGARLGNSMTFTGKEASEDNFFRFAPVSDIIHVSMHALQADSGLQAENACLVFDNRQDSIEDGKVHIYELYPRQFYCELAILSTCQSGAGEIHTGEGIISLGRAFRFAGSRNVLMSIWNVDDYASSQLIPLYTQALADGIPKAKAMNMARYQYLHDANRGMDLLPPYYWASFVLYGDNTPVVKDSRLWAILLWGILILVIPAFFWFFGKQVTFRRIQDTKGCT